MNPVWVDEQGNVQEMNEHAEDNENAHTVSEQDSEGCERASTAN